MKRKTTEDVARLAGISTRTLERWLLDNKIEEPKRESLSGFRIWTAQDIERVKRFARARAKGRN